MRYVAVIPSKNQLNTTILELTPEAYVVPIDNRQAVTALEEMETSYFANAADHVSASVIPIIEAVEFEETPVLELTEEMLEEFQDRFDRMNDPNDSLMETEFLVNGVKVKLVN